MPAKKASAQTETTTQSSVLASRSPQIRKVFIDKVFALHKSEVINDVFGVFDNNKEVSFDELMKTVDEIDDKINSELKEIEDKTTKQKSPIKRTPTNYNVFVKSMIQQLKKKYPDADKNILMKDCGTIWSHLKNDVNFAKDDRDKVENLQLKDIKGLPVLQSVNSHKATPASAHTASETAPKAKARAKK